MSEALEVEDAMPTDYAAWIGTWNEDEGSFVVEPDDMLFTDSIEEARLWRTKVELAEGQTLGISDRDGVVSTITHEDGQYGVWVREELV